jgi:hypothetical protein
MTQLFDKETGQPIGEINDTQLQFLVDQLEEESAADQDYYINEDTIAAFESEGADSALVALLRGAMGGREEMEIRWSNKT